MEKIVISKTKENLIGLVLFFSLLILSVSYQYLKYYYLTIETSFIFMLVIFPVTLILLHEVLHYIGFLLAKIKIEQLILRSTKPYPMSYISTNVPIKNTTFAFILLLPTLVLGIFTAIPVLFTSNLSTSFIFSITIGVGAGDILLAFELLKLKKFTLVKAYDEKVGVYILGTHSHSESV